MITAEFEKERKRMKEELKKSLRTYGALLLLGVTGVPLGAAVGLIEALFCEVNPIPVKTALNLMGWKVGPTRMPLCEMEPENEERLKKALADYGIKLA